MCLVLLNLLIFKYFTFFGENLSLLLHQDWAVPQILLPIGISFYTFQILSYVIDLYFGRVRAAAEFLLPPAVYQLFPPADRRSHRALQHH